MESPQNQQSNTPQPEPQPAGATAITPAGQKKVTLFSDGTFVEAGRTLPWIVLAAVVGVLGWIVMDAWSSTWQEVAVSQIPTVSLNHRAKRPPAFADTSGWKTYRNEQYGFEVKYPDIDAYFRAIGGWTNHNEPEVISRTPFNYSECVPAGGSLPGEPQKLKLTIADRQYCLIVLSGGGAAGSGGTSYEYISRVGNEDIGISFQVIYPLDKGIQLNQDARSLFDQIISTFKFIGLKRVCPDAWIKNVMPRGGSEYFIISGERAEIADYDVEWIRVSCKVNKPQIVS